MASNWFWLGLSAPSASQRQKAFTIIQRLLNRTTNCKKSSRNGHKAEEERRMRKPKLWRAAAEREINYAKSGFYDRAKMLWWKRYDWYMASGRLSFHRHEGRSSWWTLTGRGFGNESHKAAIPQDCFLLFTELLNLPVNTRVCCAFIAKIRAQAKLGLSQNPSRGATQVKTKKVMNQIQSSPYIEREMLKGNCFQFVPVTAWCLVRDIGTSEREMCRFGRLSQPATINTPEGAEQLTYFNQKSQIEELYLPGKCFHLCRI